MFLPTDLQNAPAPVPRLTGVPGLASQTRRLRARRARSLRSAGRAKK